MYLMFTFLLSLTLCGHAAGVPVHDHATFCRKHYNNWGPYAVGECENVYLTCAKDGVLGVDNCDGNSVFSERNNECVDRSIIGCLPEYFCSGNDHVANPKLQISRCGTEYVACTGAHAFIATCTGGKVFINGVCRFPTSKEQDYCYDWSDNGKESDGLDLVPFPELTICSKGSPGDGDHYFVPVATGCGGYFAKCVSRVVVSIKQCDQQSVLRPDGLCEKHPGCTAASQPQNHQYQIDQHRPYQGLMGSLQFCGKHPDGLYKPHACSPEATYCANHQMFNIFCPPGTTLDIGSKQCYPLDQYEPCSSTSGTGQFDPEQFIKKLVRQYCSGDTNGGLHPFGECDPWFVDCAGLKVHSCNYGTIFDPFAESCIHPEASSVCYAKMHQLDNDHQYDEPVPNSSKDPPYSKLCDGPRKYILNRPCSSQYILCVNAGKQLILTCPYGKVFWLEKKACVPETSIHVDCGPREHPGGSSIVPNCDQQPEGHMAQDFEYCGQYYQCVHGDPVKRKCGDGTGFDPQMNQGAGGCNFLNQLYRSCII